MNLFDSIGLNADPFSTSPNVDLFYPAVEHRQCLEGLELAIRMRRGLSVIRGGIGVGKTTISRKLIQNFKDESDDFDFYLILDPKFESEIILLKHIIELFGVRDSAESVQDCRNIIENHLLKVGVEQGKTLVLIVDEGQNLPGEMLDVFRTLLNFETDDFKLLQLIIFGQPEMGAMIHKYPNFEDRISFDFEVGPISLEDMKGMIDHRIDVTGGIRGSWFNEKALIKIHKNTQGYPRKVTQLCHQLLLTMMSEDKTDIDEEMVQRVMSGKLDTGGLLKQKKKNYNEIAVNKLLDVLRKDEDKTKGSGISHSGNDDLDDDDWIGGNAPEMRTDTDKETVDDNIPITEDLNNKGNIASNSDTVVSVDNATNEKQISSPPDVEESEFDEFLPTQGSYPPHIKQPLVNYIPLDKTYTGISIDEGRMFLSVILENKGKKTLLALEMNWIENNNLDFSKDSIDLKELCVKAITSLEEKLINMDEVYSSSIKSVGNKDTITISINDDKILMHMVPVPKENKKEKDQIIDWTIKKTLPYPIEECLIDHLPGKRNVFYVGTAKKSIIANMTAVTEELEWQLRKWYPLSQSIFNAFSWNYPEFKMKNVLILHIGEKNSFIMSIHKFEIMMVKPLFLGIQNLTDSLADNGISLDNWSNRKGFQIPESFLRAMGQNVSSGQYDDIFRPVFDSWRQEIDRTVNGMRKDCKITESTDVLLSGSSGEVLFFDRFIEGTFGLNTRYLNPFRNLGLVDSLDDLEIDSHPSLFAGAIGSALDLKPSINLLPKQLKLNETFRWANRFGLVATAAAFIFFVVTSVSTKLSINSIQSEVQPLKSDNSNFSFLEDDYRSLEENKASIEEQIDILGYDIKYFDRILKINQFLSYYTPKEIMIKELNFQQGWEKQGYKKMGRDLVKVVTKVDEHLRIVRLGGNVNANSYLINDHFDNFVGVLRGSGLFQNVEIIESASPSIEGKENLQFLLKCVI